MSLSSPSPSLASAAATRSARGSLLDLVWVGRLRLLRLSVRLWLIAKTLPVLWHWSGTVAAPADQPSPESASPDDKGQTTAEYGLVILAAGTLALAVILWARSSGSITSLFESVVEQLTGSVG